MKGLGPLAASAATVGIVVAILGLHGASSVGHDVSAGSTSLPSVPSGGKPTAIPTPAAVAAVAACSSAQLSGRVVRSAGEMSQNLEEIALTNAGPRPCRLSGYPQVDMLGTGDASRSVKLNTSLTHGGNHFTTDPGPTTVDIAAGKSAWFALSTATAYGSKMVAVDRVAIAIGPTTGSGVGHVDVAVSMGATSPPGLAIPVIVSAFAGGVPQVPGSSTSTAPQLSNTVTAAPAKACFGSQLRPSLGVAGPALGTGHTQILLKNVGGQPCYLGGLFPLRGVYASGTSTRLVFPGDSASAFPSPVVPGNLAPGHFGAFWVSTMLNAGQPGFAVGAPRKTGCHIGVHYESLVIEISPNALLKMAWPTYLSNGCLDAESSAGPFPQPIPSIP